MKLAEALIERKDLQTRQEELRNRLTLNALVQEGETPAEDPIQLLEELDAVNSRLEALVAQINLTNAAPRADGSTLTQMLAHRESLSQKVSIMNSLLDRASGTVMRGTRTEVKILSTVPVAELRKRVDGLSKELRECDTQIQALNWLTELQ